MDDPYVKQLEQVATAAREVRYNSIMLQTTYRDLHSHRSCKWTAEIAVRIYELQFCCEDWLLRLNQAEGLLDKQLEELATMKREMEAAG